MTSVYVSGTQTTSKVSARLRNLLEQGRPAAIGMATAFLSIAGAQTYDEMYSESRADSSRVVVGVDGAITHPHAVEFLSEQGHSVRIGRFAGGIFHPKLLVGGDRFLASGHLGVATCGYVGSANFTGAGLSRNLEVLIATHDQTLAADVSVAFSRIWSAATQLTSQFLSEYEHTFARAQRRRSAADLKFLEVVTPEQGTPPLILPLLCSAVWAGLQSFTGEHTFQVEFPRTAGEALRTLLGTDSGDIEIECADGQPRRMTYRYYKHNGMYRLNVPNSMPLVQWARDHHQGALLVWSDDMEEHPKLNAEIIRGRRLSDIAARSRALGSWGKTTTRQYGWY